MGRDKGAESLMVKQREYSRFEEQQLAALREIAEQLRRAVDRIEALQEEIHLAFQHEAKA